MNNESGTLAIFGGTPVRSDPMPFRQAFGPKEVCAVESVIAYYAERDEDPPYNGHFEHMFCEAFSEFMGGGFSDAVSTGSAAVYVALAALEIERGKEVILSPVTDSSCLNAIILQGYIPVIADSRPDSFNIGVDQFLERVTPHTAALIAVHSGGEPLEMDRIVDEAHKRNILVLEDCSQAVGAVHQGRRIGAFGDIAAFSTMYRKSLSAGASSGLVYCRDEALYHKVLGYADRGKPVWRTDLDLRNPGYALFPALNFNTDEISCAIGHSSLKRLQETIDTRLDILQLFVDKLRKESQVCRPSLFHRGFSPFFFPVIVDCQKISCSKIDFAEAIHAEGIGLGAHYGCVVCSWPWAEKYISASSVTPNAFSMRDRSFNVYCNERYTEREVDHMITAIKKVEQYYKLS